MDKMFAKISKNNFGMKLVLVHELSSTHSFQITSRFDIFGTQKLVQK
jgi:hypothetical protein